MCPGRPYILGSGKFSPRALPPSAVLAQQLQGVGTATTDVVGGAQYPPVSQFTTSSLFSRT